MGSFPLIFSILVSFCAIVSCSSNQSTNFIIYPPFSSSNVHFIDGSIGFLTSLDKTFKAAILSPGGQGGSGSSFYMAVLHVPSNTIIWSANRDAPISSTGTMTLSATGMVIAEEDGTLIWSTPALKSPVSSLQLSETGNLVLLDQSNATLWESFDYPTDTIVIGQKLPVGVILSSAVSSTNLSVGSYSLSVTPTDVLLQWQNTTYWKLSMDTAAYSTSATYQADYMAINQSGLYLNASNGSAAVHLNLTISDFGIAKLDYSGQFSVSSFLGSALVSVLEGPPEKCKIPLICGALGLCSEDASILVCSCPANFGVSLPGQNSTGCVPSDGTYSLSSSCNSAADKSNTGNSSSLSYLSLGNNIDYFANSITSPTKSGVDLSGCQDLCSSECSCLGIFYDNSSDACYFLQNQVGSIMSISNDNLVGFVKAIVGPSPSSSGHGLGFPIVAVVLLPLIGFFLLAALGVFLWRKSRSSTKTRKLKRASSAQAVPWEVDLELNASSIPGLPVRFGYEEMEAATDKFKTLIGSGGFGAVYKGSLPDKSLVAVKKLTNFGVHGMRDFCRELAIIGNIHHINLVKLIGFCAQGSERLLVYEYMNHGSLDRVLFNSTGVVLEWKERVTIALGMARGLAYLHSGCQQKIIHCDIKPENILLHDNFQPKISDFGLSKLLSPEQSSLFTTMRGTRGYLAPEWLTGSGISDKTDVYSFGMVLLEIVSGRKNCSFRKQGVISMENGYSSSSSDKELVYFPMLALEMHEGGRYLELADPKLEAGRVSSEDVEKLVRVALCCVHEDPTLRPNMVNVVSMLEGDVPLGKPKLESLNFLRFYGRRFAQASITSEKDGQDEFIFPELNASFGSSSSLPLNPSSITSHQISGPR